MAATRSPLDLHWRLFGIDFRVHPSFWLINLLFGYLYVQNLRHWQDRKIAYLAIWLGAAFVSILVHELGHVTAARIFGVRSNIHLYWMGGLAMGNFEQLRRWQRIIVSAAGPAFGLGLFAFVEWVLPRLVDAYDPSIRSNPNRWYDIIANPAHLFEEGDRELVGSLPGILIIMNLIWNLFNLLPIIPLDGGMIMREVVTIIFPRRGLWLAYGLSFLFAGSIAFYSLLAMWRPVPYYPRRLDPLFMALVFAWIAIGSFSTMQSLAPAEPEQKRWREYEEKDW
jgi:Zn-dependent protease